MNKNLNKWEVLIENNTVKLKIGVQMFTIDYDQCSDEEVKWLAQQLEIAMNSVAPSQKKSTIDQHTHAMEWLLKHGLVNNRTEVVGDEYTRVMAELNKMTPMSTSNNQRTITEEYHFQNEIYDVTYGLFDQPMLEKKNKA